MNRKAVARRVGVQAGARRCDDCRGPMKTAKRIEKGMAYCASCYHRQFERVPCGSCGNACIAKKHELEPRCRICTVRDRRCIRCARPVPQAGMLVGGEPVCPSCTPHYREKKHCPLCGRMSARLSRKDGSGDAICTPCAQKDTHATCGACRRHRAIGGVNEAGKLLCVSCALPEAATHACSGCGRQTPGSGRAQCHECAARRRGTARMDLETAKLAEPWVRSLFRDFCTTCLLAQPDGDVTAHVARAAGFFSTIGAKIASRAAVTPASLLAAAGPERLRRASKAVAWLSRLLGLEWPAGAKAEHADEARIGNILAEADGQPWVSDLRNYLADLRDPDRTPPLKARTIRVYLRAAHGLLDHSSRDSARETGQDELAGFLRRKPGQRASLAPFVDWLGRARNRLLVLPPGKKRDGRTLEKAMLAKGALVMERLEAATETSEARALLAAAISTLYRVPLETVLALRHDDVETGAATILWPEGLNIMLETRLAVLFTRWAGAGDHVYLFGSASGVGQMSASGVSYYVQQVISEKIRFPFMA